MPAAALIAETPESLTWFLGNTFALAVWWVMSGVLSGIFLALFGGTVAFMLTGNFHTQRRFARGTGIVGGALAGMIGGMSVGRLGGFGGLIGLIYLWALVGMLYAAFLGVYVPRSAPARFDDDWGPPGGDGPEEKTVSLLDELSEVFTRPPPGENRADEVLGMVCGAVAGVFYGTTTGLFIPLSTSRLPAEDLSRTVTAAAIVWSLLAGFGAWVGSRRVGVYGGMIAVVTGLAAGSAFGGIVALFGQVFGDVVCGAINGAIGGAFFGSAA